MLGISRQCLWAGTERSLLALWVGGLWVAGYVVAPILFATLDDRQLAGQLAGQVFRIMSYVGLAVGSVLLLSVVARVLRAAGGWAREWRIWALTAMLVLVIIGAFVIQPMMVELKAGGIVADSEQAKAFGRLHGVSSILFMLTSLLGLSLVAVGLRGR
ncbi:MAG: DUF4149 domain-containing protein [Ectothiorhodospiraceae bacterium]|nr:DUF4149 domain-containing protein [Ectothiorhodospiraceae bacterium]